MYNPKSFEESDKETLIDFIRKQPFATLVTPSTDLGLEASHIPLYPTMADGKDYLVGHLARMNPQWKELGGRGLAIFQGPHAYVSHKWYGAPNTVPTWNYVAVHVTGRITLTGPEELVGILDMMLAAHEGDAALARNNMQGEVFRALLGHIVGIRMEVERIEGKWKLSQNKSAADQARIAEGLAHSEDWNARQVAALMIRNLARK